MTYVIHVFVSDGKVINLSRIAWLFLLKLYLLEEPFKLKVFDKRTLLLDELAHHHLISVCKYTDEEGYENNIVTITEIGRELIETINTNFLSDVFIG